MQLERMIEEIAEKAAYKAAEIAHKPTMMTREQMRKEFGIGESTVSKLIKEGVFRYGVHFVTPQTMTRNLWKYTAVRDTLEGRLATGGKVS